MAKKAAAGTPATALLGAAKVAHTGPWWSAWCR